MLGPSSAAPVNVTNVSAQDKLMPVTETNKVSPDASFKTRMQIAFTRSFQLTRGIVKSKNEFTEEPHGFTCLDTYGKLSKKVSFNGYEIFALFYLIILVIMPSNIHGRPLGHSCPLLSPNSDNFSTLASSIRPPDVAYPPFMIYPTGSLLPLPPLLSPFYPSKSLNHPNKLYYVKTIGFILLGLAVPILLTVMRVIWNNAKLTRNFTRVVTDAVQNAQMGNISINDAVSRIQQYPRVERAVSHIILELVRNSTENGGIAGNILANLDLMKEIYSGLMENSDC